MSTDDPYANVAVIVRECGERTADACVDALRHAGVQELTRITTTPFNAALRQSLEAGIESGRAWTLCIDADVLVIPDGMRVLLETAQRAPAWVLEAQGLVHDKFFGITRPAGNHLYRSALLKAAVRNIPAEGTSLRPESDMLARMHRFGKTWLQLACTVGVHDYEQTYADIYRKCLLQAHKHSQHLQFPKRLWQALALTDPDFIPALDACTQGQAFGGTMRVDRNFQQDRIAGRLAELGLVEKPAVNALPAPVAMMQSLIDRIPQHLHDEHSRFEQQMHRIFLAPRSRPGLVRRIKRRLRPH